MEDRAKAVIAADVRLISGCEDAQTSADVCDVANFKLPDPAGRGGGACTSGLLQVLYADHQNTAADLSFEQVLLNLRENLEAQGLSQIPQLSSSHLMDMKQPFHIVPIGSTGTRRAVMIGINYTGQDGELSGCQNDVKNMKEYLQRVHGFQEENITLMLDDKKHIKPTRQNITKAFRQVAQDSQPGDVVFCHFSGHGGKIRDFDGDEGDGYDETLIPVDFEKSGQIRDDYLFQKLVCPMKEGVTMTCLFDCCHSGTVLDLPFVFKGDGSQDAMVTPEGFSFDRIDQAATAAAATAADYANLNDSGDDDSRPTRKPTNPTAANDGPPNPHVMEPSGNVQEVFVKHGRNSITIKADIDDKFLKIKQAVQEKTGVPVVDQILIYNGLGIKFADDKSLSYYGCSAGGFFTLTEKKR